MTNQEFIKTWLGYCAANGVTETPRIESGNGLPIDGYVPPTYLVWRTQTGDLVQGVEILMMTDNPQSYLKHIQFAYGLPLGEKVTWRDYLNPPPVKSGESGDPVVGDLFDAAKRLFAVKAGGIQEGASYTMPGSGRRFIAVHGPTPFSIFWKEL